MLDKSEWPPYTCVACYLYNSLRSFNIQVEKDKISQELGIRIPKNTYNPYSLEETDDDKSWGISSEKATEKINSILKVRAPYLLFRHIPLNMIPYGMYEEVLGELFWNKVTVGIGYDFSDVSKQEVVFKHLSFLRKRNNNYVVEDFYIKEGGTIISIEWDGVIQSANKIGDGFWLIGKHESLFTSII